MLCTARHPGMITSEMMCTFSFFLILSLIEAYGKTVRPAAQKPYSLSVFATVLTNPVLQAIYHGLRQSADIFWHTGLSSLSHPYILLSA